MANTKLNSLSRAAVRSFRPALVEARLINEKHAHDPIYVATLMEELRTIEGKLAVMERTLHLDSAPAPVQLRPCRAPEYGPDARWIRDLSSELDMRLRRIEESGNRQDLEM